MSRLPSLHQSVRSRLILALMIGVSFYFCYHLVYGNRGLMAYRELSRHEEVWQVRLAELQEERKSLEERVSRLRPRSLDPDLLEEQALKILGYGYHHETRTYVVRPAS